MIIHNDEWEGEAPTHHDIHHRCGNGRSIKEIAENFRWLEDRDYLKGGGVRPCAFAKITGYASPVFITDAGKPTCIEQRHKRKP